jgi:hypothetical protein
MRMPTKVPPFTNKAKAAHAAANMLVVLARTGGSSRSNSEKQKPITMPHIMGSLHMRSKLSLTVCCHEACSDSPLSAMARAKGMTSKFSINTVKAKATPAAGPSTCNKMG